LPPVSASDLEAGVPRPPTATTGLAELDSALGGLFWGDNVVWETEDAGSLEPFFAAVARSRARYDFAAWVTLTRSPDELEALYPGFEIIDARPGSGLAQPGVLIQAVRKACAARLHDLVLFDGLEAMSERWGAQTAQRFFTLSCPLLLELGAIAYWSLAPKAHSQAMRREIEGVTQCVVVLQDGRLRVAKAEGRPPGIEGSVFRYRVDDGAPVLAAAPAAARLGTALRSVRTARGLSQSDLARLAGVSPSAISQAERGRRGLSLDTLLDLSAKLNITLDELLRGDVVPGYRLVRRDDPRTGSGGGPHPLLDDPRVGLRAYALRLSPGESATPSIVHKGVELVTVAFGLVQVRLTTGQPVLRSGEALIAESSRVEGWRNLADRDALVFWVLRDEAKRSEAD
jgi:transcriptional regulator with XRE-family HTH domain